MTKVDEIVDRVAPLMKPRGEILVAVSNRRSNDSLGFAHSIAFHAPRLLRPAVDTREVHFVPASRFRWSVFRTMTELGARAQRNPATGIPALVVAGGFLAAAGFVANLAVGKTRKTLLKGISSSVLFVLDVNNGIARENLQVLGQSHRPPAAPTYVAGSTTQSICEPFWGRRGLCPTGADCRTPRHPRKAMGRKTAGGDLRFFVRRRTLQMDGRRLLEQRLQQTWPRGRARFADGAGSM